MTEIERLEAERARIDAQIAELRAKEPDWGPAVDAFWFAFASNGATDNRLEATRTAFLAARPLAPVAPMSEEEIEGLARECLRRWTAGYGDGVSPQEMMAFAIRETLRRAPKAWPSEAIEAAYREGYKQGANDTPNHLIEDDAWRCSEAARRIKAWQTGESA